MARELILHLCFGCCVHVAPAQTSWGLRLLCEDPKTRTTVADAGGVSALITLCEASSQRVVLEEATRALKALTEE